MARVKFLERRVVNDGRQVTVYEKDQIVDDMNEASVRRWLRRGVVQVLEKPAEDHRSFGAVGSGTPSNAVLIIVPDNWRTLDTEKMKALAANFTPDPITNKREARAAIEAELARRASQATTETATATAGTYPEASGGTAETSSTTAEGGSTEPTSEASGDGISATGSTAGEVAA